MESKEAIKVLEQAINIAVTKGIFGLNDIRTIIMSLDMLKQGNIIYDQIVNDQPFIKESEIKDKK